MPSIKFTYYTILNQGYFSPILDPIPIMDGIGTSKVKLCLHFVINNIAPEYEKNRSRKTKIRALIETNNLHFGPLFQKEIESGPPK